LPEIEIKELIKRFGNKEIFNKLSLKLPQTGFVGFFAPSGSGKTTLLDILAGLRKADGGEILGLSQKKISYAFQHNSLLPFKTCLQNVLLVPERAQNRSYSAEQLLRMLSARELAEKMPEQISGGEKRRIILARTLFFEADIYLFDEPFAGLDIQSALACAEVIKKVCKNKLCITATHNQDELAALAEQIFYL
jgi:NitT/TauT family transport system ATP-binding protein